MAETPISLPKATPLHYRLICWACLAGMFLACFEQGQIFRGALLILVGMVSLLMALRAAPGLMMFALGASILAEAWAMRGLGFPRAAFDPADLLLPICMLGYIVSHLRLTALTQQLFPDDPRPRPFDSPGRRLPEGDNEGPPSLPTKRGVETLHAEEIVWFAISLLLATLAAQFAWTVLSTRWQYSGITPRFFRLVIVAWILAGSMLLVGAVLRMWRRRHMTRDEGLLLLQEELWGDLQRDQSRIIRWRSWAKSRSNRK
ncbi:MAG: hypothetical protein K2X38_16425 [Gemmataceae bacterium]|nr:hypothetical protein [Gemmataceae bacterium]